MSRNLIFDRKNNLRNEIWDLEGDYIIRKIEPKVSDTRYKISLLVGSILDSAEIKTSKWPRRYANQTFYLITNDFEKKYYFPEFQNLKR